MKIQHAIYILLSSIILFSGCREITVTTKVNRDGSFPRTIKVTGDSADVFRTNLPYPIDATWVKTVLKDTTDVDDYTIFYTKSFKKSELLNIELSQDTSWKKHLQRKVTIDKRCVLFYSYTTFSETYKAIRPFTRLNYPNYLTPEEKLYLSGNKIPITASDSIKDKEITDKFIGFFVDAIAIEIISTLEDGIKKLNDPQHKPEHVQIYKDSIVNKVYDYFENFDVYIDFYREWTGNESVNKLKTLEPPLFEALDKKISIVLNLTFMDGYSQTVEMPGIITETNSISVTGNQVSWEVNSNHFLFEDYEMRVESRVVNRWAFVVSGLFLFLVIILLFLKVRRK